MNRRAYFRRRMRRKRAEWRRTAICTDCGTAPATEGMRTCAECRAARKAKDEARDERFPPSG